MSAAISSPCRQICRLGSDRRCDGCGRTVEEIVAWISLSEPERRRVMDRLADWEPREPPPPPR